MHLPKGYFLNNRYRIEKVLGQGGFGKTYLAYDQALNHRYCIKELFISGSSTRGPDHTVNSEEVGDISFAEFKAKFILEAQELARFNHPCIVKVVNVFEANSTAYYVMEYIEGETLKACVERNGPLPRNESIAVMQQLLDAVEEVHNTGKLHRDIKPDNVLITPSGKVVLIDFGSVREFDNGKTITHTAFITPGYAPLEQYHVRGAWTAATDIYALGGTMYFLLTGQKPLSATERVGEIMLAPDQLNSAVDSQISSAVMLAMQMKVSDRFQKVQSFRETLNFLVQPSSSGNFKAEIQTQRVSRVQPQLIIEPRMVFVEGGSFRHTLGNSRYSKFIAGYYDITSKILPFFIGKYPVTQKEWYSVFGSNPSCFDDCENCPVDRVDWYTVQEFIKKLNEVTGKKYRLPHELEWEYAARDRRETQSYKYAGGNNLDSVGWFEKNSFGRTQPVGRKQPNALGVFDMSGNVWEWCQNSFTYHLGQPVELNSPKSQAENDFKVLRGGSYHNKKHSCEISHREKLLPNKALRNVGFRLAMDVD